MLIDISIHSCREGILTMQADQMTVISDQEISEGDTIHSDLHKNASENRHWNFIVDEVIEERPSKGDWKSGPPTWRKIKYTRQ